MSRDKILANVCKSQPEWTMLPADLFFEKIDPEVLISKFISVIESIGGNVISIQQLEEIDVYVNHSFALADEKISLIPGLNNYQTFTGSELPHIFESVQFALFEPYFAVAENGAVWITENRLGHRVLPFITQHLAMLVRKENIVATMHDAYLLLSEVDYGFGTFIAGPSKTADIEQSLVLGAHGARSMTIFLL